MLILDSSGRKQDLLKRLQQKAFDFSFLEHEKHGVDIPKDNCITMIHDCNGVIEIEDDSLAGCRREQFELSCYKGNYTILHKHNGIYIIKTKIWNSLDVLPTT